MARETVIKSDISGEPGARTYSLTFDGTTMEVDLTEDEAQPILTIFEKGRSTSSARGMGGTMRNLDSRVRGLPQPPPQE